MKMKKLFTIIIGIALVLSMVGTTVADEIKPDSPKTPTGNFPFGEVVVTLSVGQQYVVTIPGDFQLPANGSKHNAGSVDVTSLSLISTETLFVYVNSLNDWYLVGNGQEGDTAPTDKIPYILECTGGYVAKYGHDTEGDKHIVARTSMGEYPTYQETVCTFSKGSGTIPKYGSYSDTLTFTVEIVSNNAVSA